MNDTVWIRSTIDPTTGDAACHLGWGGSVQALLTPEVVMATARDLMVAAAGAEADIALIESLREDVHADDDVVGGLLTAVRQRRTAPAARVALRIATVAGAKTGKPYVHIARGSMEGRLNPDEARQMAQHWTEAAAAAQIDVRLRQALGEHPDITDSDIEQIFARMQALQR